MKTKQKLRYLFSLIIIAGLLIITGCKKDNGPALNNLTGFTSFGFTDATIKDFPFNINNISFVIKNTDSLPYQFDASRLTAQYKVISGSAVAINGVPQKSGVTVNNFTDDVTYAVTSEDGATTKNYRVELNVAQLNPEAVQWNQKSPNGFDAAYETQEYFYLNGKHWVLIGKKFKWFTSKAASKLYSSEDGVSWTEETPKGDFPLGYNHNIVVRDNKAYVVGYVSPVNVYGGDQPTLENNLFTTIDGVTWTKIEAALDQAGRILSPIFNSSGNIYAFGGNLQGAFDAFDGAKQRGAPFFPAAKISSSTLISTDGMTFTASTDYSTEMPKRTYAAGYVYKDKMYVAGGLNTLGYPLSDVWSSNDGITWTQVSDKAFAARRGASAIVYDNSIWMFGGQLADGNVISEILVSDDGGVTWNPVKNDQILPGNFTPRWNAEVSVDSDGNVWIVGGETVTSVTYNDDGFVDAIEYKTLTDIWSGKLNKLNN